VEHININELIRHGKNRNLEWALFELMAQKDDIGFDRRLPTGTPSEMNSVTTLWDALSNILEEPGTAIPDSLRQAGIQAIDQVRTTADVAADCRHCREITRTYLKDGKSGDAFLDIELKINGEDVALTLLVKRLVDNFDHMVSSEVEGRITSVEQQARERMDQGMELFEQVVLRNLVPETMQDDIADAVSIINDPSSPIDKENLTSRLRRWLRLRDDGPLESLRRMFPKKED